MPDLDKAKKAAKAAATYYKELVPKVKLNKIRIEEIEYSEANNEFKITLSHPEEESDSLFGYGDKRDYKTFVVDVDTSIVKAMKIREA